MKKAYNKPAVDVLTYTVDAHLANEVTTSGNFYDGLTPEDN